MGSGARARGSHGGLPPRKLARHNAEAGSTSRPAVKLWRSKQARERGRLSRSGRRSVWASFNELHEVLFPLTMRCRKADAELLAVDSAVAAGEEGTSDRLAAAKEDHAYAHAWRKVGGDALPWASLP